MCGIAGIYRFGGEGDDLRAVERMLEPLGRRGPDDRGIESLGRVTLGHRRLAILDLTPAGHQPMRGPGGRLVVTFNGEIYNHRELRREMGLRATELRSASDTEILLHAWERWGPEALDRFVGPFAFALLDTTTRTLWLARDRFGEKPLFVHADSSRLAFASSLAALVAAPGTPRELDRGALAEYLALHFVVSPRTVLRDCTKLPPGTLATIGPGGVVGERTWYAPRFRPRRRPRGEAVEEFDERFGRACERCLVSDVPAALLLSDGIDSNAVRAALAGRGHAPPSFTYRAAPQAGVTIRPPAGAVGEVVEIEVAPPRRFEQMRSCLGALTEPVGDGAALATWQLIRGARSRATVFLCGHGGDEIVGGYRLSQDRFRLALLHRLARLRAPGLGPALDRFLYGVEPLAERRAAFLRAGPGAAAARARYLVSRPLPAREVASLFGGALPAGESYLASVTRLYRECDPFASNLDRMQEVMIGTFLSSRILPFADAVAMDSSAELRMPFLDRDLVELVLSLPPNDRVAPWPGRNNTKRVLRRWAKTRLPREIVRRRKRGFAGGNVADLVRLDRAGLLEHVLGARAVRRALPGLEPWLEAVPAGHGGPHGGTLWSLVALGVWSEAVGVC